MFSDKRSYKRLESQLGGCRMRFLVFALDSFERIMPHTSVSRWAIKQGTRKSSAAWGDPTRRKVNLSLGICFGNCSSTLSAVLKRRTTINGVGNSERTIDTREMVLCKVILDKITEAFASQSAEQTTALDAIQSLFDEQVVAQHIQTQHNITVDLGVVFRSLRQLSEQSYENKSLSFGCLIVPDSSNAPANPEFFSTHLREWKRYRALSDGYRTAYRVAGNGQIIGFVDLATAADKKGGGSHYFPEWCRDMATASRNGICGISLTRQGDILFFDSGTLRFAYRFGRWQYWNHSHIIELLKSKARVQRVNPKLIGNLVSTLYRASLDISFRRAGGLFVLLRKKESLSDLVPAGDAIGGNRRDSTHAAFDSVLESKKIQNMPRSILIELATIDGAVVVSNSGEILAYASVLQPKRKGKAGPAEGSRTKAAIGASKYGIAVKVSADGDIAFYGDGQKSLHI